ncbi:MAG: FAD-binding protein [Phycisphaerae bacterium]|jgi:succinate dehydrogenase/fumarate reductase flavoprotein subunit
MDKKTLTVEGLSIPVTCVNTVIVGAGAAGMTCAVRCVKFWRGRGIQDGQERLLVVTAGLGLGASRMSGSDKQTYYKMGTSPRVPDSAEDFAKALTAFGCCHGDHALIEGLGSLRAFYHLVEAGVPFPHDACGAFIGYKTDHDPYERATSAGPKTSKFMAEALQAEAQRLGVAIVDKQVVVDFLTEERGEKRRIVGMVCLDLSRRGKRGLALSAYVAENWVLAAGGPGELYAASVYPRGQSGIHGPALKAGLVGCNFTESQYGLASVKFRWNVSGTYMQAVPRIYSTDAAGSDEREFLAEYFDDTATMATDIFLKGYQWPFDAQRITGRQSSLIDMAVHQETVVRGRRVWMDFRHNPQGRPGWEPFSLQRLGAEAQTYLRKAGATQEKPIDRLRHMNAPAIELYAEHGIDLGREGLEIAVCAQHHNGGFAVNTWWESNVPHVFVIGEMAGTHGVKRPGGAALNAGQVGAMRAAEYLTHAYSAEPPKFSARTSAVRRGLAEIVKHLRGAQAKGSAAKTTPREMMDQIAQRMTRHGAHLRSRRGAATALQEAKAQYRRCLKEGLKLTSPAQLRQVVLAEQQSLAHVAMLKVICEMFQRGAGSRGSHCILAADGVEMHPALVDPDTGKPYRFCPENADLRNSILHLRYNSDAEDLFDVWDSPPRAIPSRDIAFEPAWAEFREGRIYKV